MGDTVRETVTRWHSSSIYVGMHPDDVACCLPDGWSRHSEWEIVTAVWAADGGFAPVTMVVWKCRISREMEVPYVAELPI